MTFLRKNSFRFRRMWRKLLKSIDEEPIEDTPTVLRMKQVDPEGYEVFKAHRKTLKEIAVGSKIERTMPKKSWW